MRIAFISGMSGFPWGGSEVLWSEAAMRLLQDGHGVFASVAHWPESRPPLAELQAKGATVTQRQWAGAGRRERILAQIRRQPPKQPGWEPHWHRIMDFRPDLVCISHGATSCGIEWMARCHEASVPYASIAQANSESWWPDDLRAAEITKAYLGAKKAYFVSKANLALFERQLGLSLLHGEVVHNPFNVRWDARPPWPEDDGIMHLACVARLEPRAKGQDLLFQVLANQKWRERPITVSLFGKGPCESGLRRLADLERVTDRIHFAGHIPDIEQIWHTHHALVLPSRYEGLPLSLIEAMLCGRPAIVTDVAGSREPLEDNVTGFLAQAPTARHLDEAMERAWHRRSEWQTIGSAASNAIRLQIPQDPAKAFADKLLALCEQ